MEEAELEMKGLEKMVCTSQFVHAYVHVPIFYVHPLNFYGKFNDFGVGTNDNNNRSSFPCGLWRRMQLKLSGSKRVAWYKCSFVNPILQLNACILIPLKSCRSHSIHATTDSHRHHLRLNPSLFHYLSTT